jgi:hypothetical protein
MLALNCGTQAVVAWLDEACFVGGDDGLDAVTAAEFEQDASQ